MSYTVRLAYTVMLACAATQIAHAATTETVLLDVGTPGTTKFQIDGVFSELNGQPIDGSTIVLDVLFSNPVQINNLFGGGDFVTDVELYHPVSLASENGSTSGIALLDANANPILDFAEAEYSRFIGRVSSGTEIMGFENPVDGLIFHGVRFDFTLSVEPVTVNSSRFTIFNEAGELEVVPEPSAAALGLMGLGGLLMSRRRRMS